MIPCRIVQPIQFDRTNHGRPWPKKDKIDASEANAACLGAARFPGIRPRMAAPVFEAGARFLLVVVAAGAAVVGAASHGAITLSMKVVAPGLMVMAIIYFMGTVGGAHLNPAVTLAFAARRNFPWTRMPGYIAAQIAGGIAAAWFLRAMFGMIGLLGATTPGARISDFKAFVMEVLLTTGLVSTILGTASGRPQRRAQRSSRRRRLHRIGRPLGRADQRRLDEPRALVRTRPDPRRFAHGLDLCCRSHAGRHDRRRLRMDPQRPADCSRRLGGARGAGAKGGCQKADVSGASSRRASVDVQDARRNDASSRTRSAPSRFRVVAAGSKLATLPKRWVTRMVKRLGSPRFIFGPKALPPEGFAQLGSILRRIKWKWLAQSSPSMETTLRPRRP